jgi:hypothetical protein
MEVTKFNIYDSTEYNSCQEEARVWEETHGPYYKGVMCLKPLDGGCTKKTIEEAHAKIEPFISNTLEEVMEKKQSPLCVLPQNHHGKCVCNYNTLFTHKSFQNSLAWIGTTEGDDGYVYKNRANRTFPIAIPDSIEKQIKNKANKLSCAIPLKNATTNLMTATAALDYAVMHYFIKDADTVVNKGFVDKFGDSLAPFFQAHRQALSAHYATIQKRAFDDEGHTICPVLHEKINIEHVFDSDRCNPNGIQLGHVQPRSNERFTIRGMNLLIMTRTGNRLVGEHDFTGNEWLRILQQTVFAHTAPTATIGINTETSTTELTCSANSQDSAGCEDGKEIHTNEMMPKFVLAEDKTNWHIPLARNEVCKHNM